MSGLSLDVAACAHRRTAINNSFPNGKGKIEYEKNK